MLCCVETEQVDGRDLLPEEDELDDDEIGEDELFARAVLSSEMLAVDLVDAEQAVAMADEEETAIGYSYALTDISTALRKQLDDLSVWRTEVLRKLRCVCLLCEHALYRYYVQVVQARGSQRSL